MIWRAIALAKAAAKAGSRTAGSMGFEPTPKRNRRWSAGSFSFLVLFLVLDDFIPDERTRTRTVTRTRMTMNGRYCHKSFRLAGKNA